ncbi:phosphoglycerate kinase [Candidatus Pacearchaeota archaeon]|nr:MAG: phosphoglycerate kinase [Candidatus Pacearchaeota archaeon]
MIKWLSKIDKNELKGKKIFLRVDYNVPVEDGVVKDDTRIRATFPTLNYLKNAGAKVVIFSHLGRPKGKRVKEYSLKPVKEKLEVLWNQKISFIEDLEKLPEVLNNLKEGEFALFENIRFYPEERGGDEEFAKRIASYFEVYVNDAFATAHRKHVSTYLVAKYLRQRYGGFLLEKEVETLNILRENPPKPFYCVLGGAKVSDKIGVIKNLVDKVDKFIIGGGMSYTFLKAMGVNIGSSLFDEKHFEEIAGLLNEYGHKFVLPLDSCVVKEIKEGVEKRNVENIEEGWIGVDIGEKTIARFREELLKLKSTRGSVFWNGPMGVFEIEDFSRGTKELVSVIADITKSGVFSVVGGGDTIRAIKSAGFNLKDFSFVSTGGGATLEYLSGKNLPTLEVLDVS